MKKLTKMLAITMALLMVLGAVSVAGAAYSDFTDADTITQSDAVSLMTELGIINGFQAEDGSFYFAPKANVTRAQTAKMISVVLTGGVDRGGVYASVGTNLNDIAKSWARGYINHCYTLGIVSGMGDGSFQPDGSVTGAQVAKMLLVALGYDAKVNGLVGDNWLTNTVVLAGDAGILEGFGGDVTAPISREDAALLICNALYAQMVSTGSDGIIKPRTTTGYEWISDGSGHYAAVPVTVALNLLTDKFGMSEYTGMVTSNEFTGEDDGFTVIGGRTYKVSTGLELIGHTVTVYQKGGVTAQGYYVCFGAPVDVTPAVSAVRNTPFVNSVPAQSLNSFLKANGLKSIASDAVVFENYVPSADNFAAYFGSATAPNNTKGEQLTLIDSNGDKVADIALITNTLVRKVSAISASTGKVTLSHIAPQTSGTISTYKELLIGETDIEVGDYVLVTPIGSAYYVQPATVVTGSVASWGPAAAGTFVVNGSIYTMTGSDIAGSVALDPQSLSAGTVYDFVLDANGFVAAYPAASSVFSEYEISQVLAYWTTGSGVIAGNGTYYAYIIFPDGTKGSYKVASYNGVNPTTVGGTELNTLCSSANTAYAPGEGNDYGMVYAYVNSDGSVSITEATVKYSGTYGISIDHAASGSISKGVALLGASTSIYANSATTFYYVESAVDAGALNVDTADAVYTGIANAPTDSGAAMNTAYFVKAGTKVAAAVYFANAPTVAFKDLYYFFGGYNSKSWNPATGAYVYDVTMYVDGAAQNVTATEVPAQGFYGSYTVNSLGFYTFGSAQSTTDWDYATNQKGIFEAQTLGVRFENYLAFGSYHGFVTDETKLLVAGSVAANYDITSLDDVYGIIADAAANGDTATVTVSISTTASGSITAIYVESIDIAS
ncbi:MAG: S-layer homology domain-containing protein [Oscillospiraceae bacterium]|jgi:hypothetical protein